MNKFVSKKMNFTKVGDTDLIAFMNSIFLYSQFNVVKHLQYPHLHNVFLTVNNSSFYNVYNIPVEIYTIKFQNNYDFEEDLIIKNRDKHMTFDIKKTIFLDVYNETNELIGYYKQDLNIEYVNINELRI